MNLTIRVIPIRMGGATQGVHFVLWCFWLIFQIDALPEIVAAVQGSDVEVYVDGGIRMGTDVLKALALGASAVFIGRPIIWGLSYNVSIFSPKVMKKYYLGFVQ